MAISKCSGCGSSYFEIKAVEPRGSQYKLFFVQCSSCGIPVSTEDYYNTGAQLETTQKKLDELDARIRRIEGMAANIDQNLARLAQIIQHR